MSLFRIRPDGSDPDVGDLKAGLADLRDAMYRASCVRQDPAAQGGFLEALFSDAGISASAFTVVVEGRDLPS